MKLNIFCLKVEHKSRFRDIFYLLELVVSIFYRMVSPLYRKSAQRTSVRVCFFLVTSSNLVYIFRFDCVYFLL